MRSRPISSHVQTRATVKRGPCRKRECITLSGVVALTAFDLPEMNEAGDNERKTRRADDSP